MVETSQVQTDSPLDSQTKRIEFTPLLDKIEKIERKNIIYKQNVQEERVQNVIEVREMPMTKIIQHPAREVIIQEPIKYESIDLEGKDYTEDERERLFRDLGVMDMEGTVNDDGITVYYAEPVIKHEYREVKRRVIRPIITVIHEQPVIEVIEHPVRDQDEADQFLRMNQQEERYETEYRNSSHLISSQASEQATKRLSQQMEQDRMSGLMESLSINDTQQQLQQQQLQPIQQSIQGLTVIEQQSFIPSQQPVTIVEQQQPVVMNAPMTQAMSPQAVIVTNEPTVKKKKQNIISKLMHQL
jgi:endonuclease V-like protein UPF0215 family